MLFDRFSFREREESMPEGEPVADLPTGGRTYAFTLDTRQLVLLIAGYCFLCVLVFALGIVVGRAVGQPTASVDTKATLASLPPAQVTRGSEGSSASTRIPLIPTQESKGTAVQEPKFSFSPTLPEASTPPVDDRTVAAPPQPKPAIIPAAPQATHSHEPPSVDSQAEDKHGAEAHRPDITEAKPTKSKTPLAAAASHIATSAAGDYTVQVSSFRRMDQASDLKGRLSKKGYAAYVQSVNLHDKGMWHRVRVGNYRDKAGAERVASDLRSHESLPAIVTRR